jgi:hypothetical protein
MGVSRLRLAVPAVALAILPLGLTGCGLLGGSGGGGLGGGTPVDDGPDKSRERVQSYLTAMQVKDPAAGRLQLCPAMQAAFDQAATGSNGDFAAHFKVTEATITDVRASDGTQQVSTSVTVLAEAQPAKATNLIFTVVKSGGQWCIAKEAAGTNATPPASPAAGTSG